MISLIQAIEKVEHELTRMTLSGSPQMSIMKGRTIEREFGWIFFYNSTEYLTTGNPSSMLAGNGPLIVGKSDGQLYHTGSAQPLEFYIKEIFANNMLFRH